MMEPLKEKSDIKSMISRVKKQKIKPDSNNSMQIKDYVAAVLIFLSLAVILLIIFPSPHKASDKALEASCKNNLKLIWNAICSYDQDFSCVPDHLSRLVERGYIQADILKCPLADTYGGGFYEHKQQQSECDYEYIQPKNLISLNDRDIPICYDKRDNHSRSKVSNRRNVLYIGGMVKSQSNGAATATEKN